MSDVFETRHPPHHFRPDFIGFVARFASVSVGDFDEPTFEFCEPNGALTIPFSGTDSGTGRKRPPKLSRQQRQQRRWRRDGRCIVCGRSRAPGDALYCKAHRDATRERARRYQREKHGFKPWTKGGPGRPPKGKK
jgi:hypothetical protein